MSTLLSLSSLTGFALELKGEGILRHSFIHLPHMSGNIPVLKNLGYIIGSTGAEISLYNKNSHEYTLGIDGYYLLYTFNPKEHESFTTVEFSEADTLQEHKSKLAMRVVKSISTLVLPTEPTSPKHVYIHTTNNSIYDVIPAKVKLFQ